jgi:hypothetical protein
MQAVTRNSDVFAAGVANAPVFNWVTEKRFDGDSDPFELANVEFCRRQQVFRTRGEPHVMLALERQDIIEKRRVLQMSANKCGWLFCS